MFVAWLVPSDAPTELCPREIETGLFAFFSRPVQQLQLGPCISWNRDEQLHSSSVSPVAVAVAAVVAATEMQQLQHQQLQQSVHV